MPRNDGRLEPGQRLNGAISARAWNRMMDAADVVHGERYSVEGGSSAASPKPYTWAYCKAGVTVPRWGILAITGMDVAPTSSDSADATKTFQDTPVLTGGAPSDTTTAWCVAVEPIESGKIGRVAVGGVVQCKVDVTSADDTFVTCKASTAELKSASAGEGLMLWKQSGTGTGKWALLRLGNVRSLVRGTFSAPWNKGSTATVIDSVSTGTTYTVKNYFASVTGTGTRACAIAYVAKEWILIAAECS